MFERSLSRGDVLEVIRNGEKIANYPDDSPYPTCLILGFVQSRPIHVVLANNVEDNKGIVVTAYEPDSELWDDNFKNMKWERKQYVMVLRLRFSDIMQRPIWRCHSVAERSKIIFICLLPLSCYFTEH